MSDCFVLYLLLTCMKKKTSGADKFTNNILGQGSRQVSMTRRKEMISGSREGGGDVIMYI